MKLWGARFRKKENELMEDFNSSFSFDSRLAEKDIIGSLAHVKMLVKCNLLTEKEGEEITVALKEMLVDIKTGKLKLEGDFEDIHSFNEITLTKKIGEIGKKLHTARSRNDQVAVDLRMYARDEAMEIIELLSDLIETIDLKASKHPSIMPGYTHLQRAQVVTFKHHLLAYKGMFSRDVERLESALEIMNISPLGCGALAGTTHIIDREITSEELGFYSPFENYMDGVSDRDYVLELLSDFSIIMMHLSRLSEELILWSSQEFKFVDIDDNYSTGSSIMPQKKNPDAAELIRGKTGRVYGSLMGMLTVMKGLPLTYNKDMQEDKEMFFDSIDTVKSCLMIMEKMISTLKVNEENMKKSVKGGFLNATEVADYLVSKGMPFRDAHGVVGQIVIYCEDNDKAIEDLSIEEFHKISDSIGEDIYKFIDYDEILNKGIKKLMK